MELECFFIAAIDTPDHIALAEQLGYVRASVGESRHRRPLSTNSSRPHDGLFHARFSAKRSPSKASETSVVRLGKRTEYDTRAISCPNRAYVLTLFAGHIAPSVSR